MVKEYSRNGLSSKKGLAHIDMQVGGMANDVALSMQILPAFLVYMFSRLLNV